MQTISDLLEQLVASLLASSTLLQADNNLFQTCQKLGTSSTQSETRKLHQVCYHQADIRIRSYRLLRLDDNKSVTRQ